MKNEITIFTPTYNRAYTLGRCYASLLAQTSKDFTWLIVDDGSQDETAELVARWQHEAQITIRYILQENGGKHTAHNTAVAHCETNYVLILDSDDVLDPDCIQVLESHVEAIAARDDMCGIIGNRFRLTDKTVIGTAMPDSVTYATGGELYQKYGFSGDTLRMYKTNVLKKYPFPVIAGEKFIYENVVFDKIDADYKMLVIHEMLYYSDYLEDGLTVNSDKVKLQNPIGYALSLNSSVRYGVAANKRINWTILYIIWCKKLHVQHPLRLFGLKPLYVVVYPLALVCYYLRYPRFFFKILDSAVSN